MSGKIIGRFYFKLTDSKNLIGEFSNNDCKKNYTESAVLKFRNPENGKFVGDYFSTWYEEIENESILAELKIEQKLGTENIFSLTWQIAGIPSYWGEGMPCDGMLIGDYRNFPMP